MSILWLTNVTHLVTQGFWAISVNGPWRLVFKLQETDVYEVMLIQYH